MLLKARQKPAQRFKRIEFSGALKYVLFCIYVFIFGASFDFVTQSKHSKRLHSSGRVVPPLAVRRSPTDEFFCGVPDTFCCAVLLGNFVVYQVCGFRVCSRVWDRFYLSPSPLLISRWGGCSIEQQEETGQALFFPLALRGF